MAPTTKGNPRMYSNPACSLAHYVSVWWICFEVDASVLSPLARDNAQRSPYPYRKVDLTDGMHLVCQIVQCNSDSIRDREVSIGSDCKVDIVPMLLYQSNDFLETIEGASQVRAKATVELLWVLTYHFPLAETDGMTSICRASEGSSILSVQSNNDKRGRENSCQSCYISGSYIKCFYL